MYNNNCSTVPDSFEANREDFCFNYFSSATGVSYRYNYPYYNVYSGQNCQVLLNSTYLSSTCAAVPYNPIEDDYYGYEIGEYGTIMLYSAYSQITSKINRLLLHCLCLFCL